MGHTIAEGGAKQVLMAILDEALGPIDGAGPRRGEVAGNWVGEDHQMVTSGEGARVGVGSVD